MVPGAIPQGNTEKRRRCAECGHTSGMVSGNPAQRFDTFLLLHKPPAMGHPPDSGRYPFLSSFPNVASFLCFAFIFRRGAPDGALQTKKGREPMRTYTLPELAVKKDREFFTADEISFVLNMNPQTIRDTARQRPELLGFPVILAGSRVRIPRIPFLRFMGVNI